MSTSIIKIEDFQRLKIFTPTDDQPHKMRPHLTRKSNLAFILLVLSAPQSLASPQESAVIMISGGGKLDANHYRYENNVRLFYNILSERGHSRDQIQVYFHEGAESQVRDYFNNHPGESFVNYGIKGENQAPYRKSYIKDIITGPANQEAIQKGFDQIAEQAKEGKLKRAIVFTTDHGTPNTSDYSQSYITLAHDGKLTVGEQERFVQKLASSGTQVALIGTQCFSGATMEIALRQPNACAFSAAAPFEPSRAIRQDQLPRDAKIPDLGYSSYSFWFSCAQHNPAVKGNMASEHCPPSDSADLNSDGKVSLAEAHFYAKSKMPPRSVPQMSSHYYAQKILSEKSTSPSHQDLGLYCKHIQDPSQSTTLIDALGNAVDPALKLRINERLAMERKALDQFMSDSELLRFIKAQPNEPLDAQLKKLKSAHQDFEAQYQNNQAQLRSTLKDINEIQKKEEQFRDQILQSLLTSDSNSPLKKAQEDMKKSKQFLDNPDLTGEQLQIHQNHYTFATQFIENAINKELSHPTHQTEREDLKIHRTRLLEDFQRYENKEHKLNDDYGRVRRAYQGLVSYHAVAEVLKSGTPEQKAKLVQLYECEDQAL